MPETINHKDVGRNRACTPAAGFDVIPSGPLCTGDVLLQNLAKDTSGGVSWNFEGGTPSVWTGAEPPPVRWEQPGRYRVRQIVGADNCRAIMRDTLVQWIDVVETPRVDAGADRTLCTPEEILLSARAEGTDLTYRWESVEAIDCVECPSITVRPAWTTTYYVTVTNAAGCSARDSVTIYVQPDRTELLVEDLTVSTGASVSLPVALKSGLPGEPVARLTVTVAYDADLFRPVGREKVADMLKGTQLADWSVEAYHIGFTELTLTLASPGAPLLLVAEEPLVYITGTIFLPESTENILTIAIESEDLSCHTVAPGVIRLSINDCGLENRLVRMSGERYEKMRISTGARGGPVRIGYSLGLPGQLSVQVYDLAGRRVAVLAATEEDSGAGEITIPPSMLRPGSYLISLRSLHWTDEQLLVIP